MARWQNFSIWRGRLPHWRADDVTYYLTFRHSRPLTPPEVDILMRSLLALEDRRIHLLILCVLPEQTDLIFRVVAAEGAAIPEFSDFIERAKTRAGKRVIKRTEERFSPFYKESYDRIIRDEAERESLFMSILAGPESVGQASDGYPGLWLADNPN